MFFCQFLYNFMNIPTCSDRCDAALDDLIGVFDDALPGTAAVRPRLVHVLARAVEHATCEEGEDRTK